MPGSSPTIDLREPVSRLNKVDFPTFGRPMIATRGIAMCWLKDSKVYCAMHHEVIRSKDQGPRRLCFEGPERVERTKFGSGADLIPDVSGTVDQKLSCWPAQHSIIDQFVHT